MSSEEGSWTDIWMFHFFWQNVEVLEACPQEPRDTYILNWNKRRGMSQSLDVSSFEFEVFNPIADISTDFYAAGSSIWILDIFFRKSIPLKNLNSGPCALLFCPILLSVKNNHINAIWSFKFHCMFTLFILII